MESELIGKKVYRTSHYGIDSILGIVDKVTKTQILVRDHKFRIEDMSKIGGERWSIYGYKLETVELNEKWDKKQLLKEIATKISTSNYEDKLPLEAVKTAHSLIINK